MSSDPPNRPKTYDMNGDARMDARDDGCGDYMTAWDVDDALRERDAEVARLREENERLRKERDDVVYELRNILRVCAESPDTFMDVMSRLRRNGSCRA